MRTAICTWLLVVAAIAGCGPSSSTKEAAVSQSLHGHEEKQIEVPPEHVGGEAIYTKKCSLCHETGEAAAPRIGNVKQWSKRVGKGIDELTQNANDGFEGKWGEMPPQGDDLSVEEIRSAVGYMLFRYEAAAKANE